MCKFYERDEAAFQEHIAYMKHCAAENPEPYMDGEESDSPCYNFCKHFVTQNGYPGETLYCYDHPDNRRIIEAESVFDGVDSHEERMRILDAIC